MTFDYHGAPEVVYVDPEVGYGVSHSVHDDIHFVQLQTPEHTIVFRVPFSPETGNHFRVLGKLFYALNHEYGEVLLDAGTTQ
jgi:hypothetical protein